MMLLLDSTQSTPLPKQDLLRVVGMYDIFRVDGRRERERMIIYE